MKKIPLPLLSKLSTFLLVGIIVGWQTVFAQSPTVQTNRDDYQPGDTVIVTGTGWLAGETVLLEFVETPMIHAAETLYTVADTDGNILDNQYIIEEHDLGQSFTLTATGQTSGLTAETFFTDGPKVGSVAVGAQSPTPVTAGSSATYTITVDRGSGGGSSGTFTAALTVTTTLPTGGSASFSPNPVSFAPGDASKTSTLTISTTASTPGGTTSFTVKAATSASDTAVGTGSLAVTSSTIAPIVTTDPSNQTITYGSNATFSAAASGTPTPTVQWQEKVGVGAFADVANGGVYSGATTATLTLTNPPVSMSTNQYRAVFTNAGGSANTTEATLTVNKATASISVSGYSVEYDGNPHGLSGTASGVGGADLSSFLSYGSALTNVPGGSISWSFDAGTNYNTASGSATVTITPAPTTTTASSATATFSSTDQSVTLSATVVGSTVNEGTVTFSVWDGAAQIGSDATSGTVSSGNASASYTLPGGTAVNTYTIKAVYNPGPNFFGSDDTDNLTVATASTAITVAEAWVQYSDEVTLTATVTSPTAQAEVNSTGGTVAFSIQLTSGGTVTFLGSVSNTSVSGGVWTGLFVITREPGSYKVMAVFTPNSTNLSGCTNDNTGPLTVNKENATAEYSGLSFFSTASSSNYKASVTLTATVVDASDGFPGDVRNAKVTFYRDAPGGTILGTANLPVGLVNMDDPTVGTATTTFDYTLNNGEVLNTGATLIVYTVVNGYYTGTGGPDNVTIAIPGTENVSGGGFVVTTNSAGRYRGKTDSKSNFGYTMKYNKSGKNLQGQANIIVRADNDSIYQIKSNAINSLNVQSNRAYFSTKANLANITDPLNPYSLGGNLALIVEMFDEVGGGPTDSVAITLQDPSGGLLYSSHWSMTRTVMRSMRQPSGGGNVSVRSGTPPVTANAGLNPGPESKFIPEEYALFQNYPNPFNPSTTVQFDFPEDSKVKILVYDILGRQVTTIVDGEFEVGRYVQRWEGKDQYGAPLASGIYFLRIQAHSLTSQRNLIAVKKMILMK